MALNRSCGLVGKLVDILANLLNPDGILSYRLTAMLVMSIDSEFIACQHLFIIIIKI